MSQQMHRQALVGFELGRAVLAVECSFIRIRRKGICTIAILISGSHAQWGLFDVAGHNRIDGAQLHLRTRGMDEDTLRAGFPRVRVAPHQMDPWV
eukprot:6458579-Amphidinium_carterae.1